MKESAVSWLCEELIALLNCFLAFHVRCFPLTYPSRLSERHTMRIIDSFLALGNTTHLLKKPPVLLKEENLNDALPAQPIMQ